MLKTHNRKEDWIHRSFPRTCSIENSCPENSSPIHVNDFNKLYYRVYTRLSNLIRIVVTNSTIRQINERVLVAEDWWREGERGRVARKMRIKTNRAPGEIGLRNRAWILHF